MSELDNLQSLLPDGFEISSNGLIISSNEISELQVQSQYLGTYPNVFPNLSQQIQLTSNIQPKPPRRVKPMKIQLTPSRALIMLRSALKTGRPVYFEGSPGIGKSSLVAEYARQEQIKDPSFRLITRIAAQMSPVELQGALAIDYERQLAKYFRQEFLPVDGRGVIFLDEMPNAPELVLKALQQLLLERVLGDYELPPGWSIIGAGNRASDRAGSNRFNTAFSTRLYTFEFISDITDWRNWACKSNASTNRDNIHFAVRAFLKFREELFNKFDKNLDKFPCPRTYHQFSDLLYELEADGLQHDSELLFAAGQATVGEAVSAELIPFYQMIGKMPRLELIYANPEGVEVPQEPSLKYAVAAAIAGSLTPTNIGSGLKYLNRMDKEFRTMAMLDATRKDDKLKTTPEYCGWLDANPDIFS